MKAEVQHDFEWQRQFLPAVKHALAEHLIVEAPWVEDAHHNTDLIVLTMRSTRVAVRLRRQDYESLYSEEFTIRSSRPSDMQTELAKVISGWGDYIFYGFAIAGTGQLGAWALGDLKVFRLWHSQELAKGNRPGRLRSNADGSSQFRAYRFDALPPSFIVARRQAQGARQ